MVGRRSPDAAPVVFLTTLFFNFVVGITDKLTMGHYLTSAMRLPPARARTADILVHAGAPDALATLALALAVVDAATVITAGAGPVTVRSFSIFPSATADSISGTALTPANTSAFIEVCLVVSMLLLKAAAVEPAKGVIVTSAMTEPAFNTTETCSFLYPAGNPLRIFS